MKKLLFLCFLGVGLTACNEENNLTNLTVYDYLTNETLLNKVLSDCVSGKLQDHDKCDVVKRAYNNLDLFKQGAISEERLKKLGKK